MPSRLQSLDNIRISKKFKLPLELLEKIDEFLNLFMPLEIKNEAKLILLRDECSDAYYLNCHIEAELLSGKSDLEAVLDPNEGEDYKLNRAIYKDNYAYNRMENDAIKGRTFEDLVIEYDNSYRSERPLKVYGGQHRISAINSSTKKKVNKYHGIRIYFCLTEEQRLDIAIANNTAIAVSNDLLDRMQEEMLGSELRDWCQIVGLLEKKQNFVDRRSPEGIPTVRLARTILVNFNRGQKSKLDSLHSPIVCSSGPNLDKNYIKFRDEADWGDRKLREFGRQFAAIHSRQRKIVSERDSDNYLEFANKMMHPCTAASFAYAAGLFQNDDEALKKHYALINSTSPNDPLNAKALSQAKLQGVDPDTYRGLGARISGNELGRMLELFILHAKKARAIGITKKLANAAIANYEAKLKSQQAEKALKQI